jgi:nucleotidyltransferase/DNA polymerase involved in DNA repair
VARHWDAVPRALAVDTTLRTVSLAAGKAGVRAGMSIPEARARCADLDVRPWDDHAIADAILAATTALLTASPQVTPTAGAPGMWWVGATGFDALGGEAQLADTLLTIARQWHPGARVAIADSCVAARAATWAPLTKAAHPHITIIPHGQCATYLAPAPLGLVPMAEELREALTALGLRTVGALAALDAGDIEQRWGNDGLTAWRLARGDDPRRPGLVRVEAARSASVELPAAVESAEPVLFVLRAQLQRLLRECVHDGRAAAAVAITLVLDAGRQYPIEDIGSEMHGHVHVPETSDDSVQAPPRPVPVVRERAPHAGGEAPTSAQGAMHDVTRVPMQLTRAERAPSLLGIPQRSITREVRPARPLARLEPLFDQCRALLERWVIPAPIIGVTVSIPATAPLAADQGDLLMPSWRDAAMNAEAVFARLRAVLDPENRGDVVVHPEARDTHRVEETGVWSSADAMTLAAAPVPAAPPATATSSSTSSPTLSVSSATSSAASSLSGDAAAASDTLAVLRLLPSPEVVEVEAPHGIPGAVWWRGRRVALATATGPERLSGDWWRGDGYARDYWRCLAEQEGELLLFHEAGMRWYVQGWYD